MTATRIKFTTLIFIIINLEIFSAIFPHFITVAKDGSGDFTTITAAIDSLPVFNHERRIIFIKNGIYEEKIRIDQDFITLRGEDRQKTIIRYSQLRSEWEKNRDSVGPAVININGDDILIENLTVENTQPEIGPHAFVVYGKGTRTIIQNCNMISKGADTVSLWDNKTGMYYHSDCFFQGAVDLVCPRGWCYVKDSRFFEVKKTAAVWHAGSYDKTQKFVIKNSSFDGIEGFKLARHHYEAQFFFIDCSFSKNMADIPIYRVTYEDTTRNQPFNWGGRYFFYNCHKENGDYFWFGDNLNSLPEYLDKTDITPAWTFEHKWDPESAEGPKLLSYEIKGRKLFLSFNEPITVVGKPVLASARNNFEYVSGGGQKILCFTCETDEFLFDPDDCMVIYNGSLTGTLASAGDRFCFGSKKY